MANFTITLNYLIVNDPAGNPQPHMTSTGIAAATSETVSETNSTSVTANGDINLAASDTATLKFNLGNDDNWAITSVQLLDQDRTDWGGSEGNKALDDDEELDYPDVDQQDGTVLAPNSSTMSISISDANAKNKTVNYRVAFKNAVSGAIIYSDPRIRDGGGAGNN